MDVLPDYDIINKGDIIYFKTPQAARLSSNCIDDVGYIKFYIDLDNQEVNVLYIYISSAYRGRGFSKILMSQMINYCRDVMKNNNIDRFEIKLDDMSDRYGSTDNLYSKFGFEYCESDENGPCGPEMTLMIS
jgi:GNAT superfamily N-acetyltransferase